METKSSSRVEVRKAGAREFEAAYAIVAEYSDAINVHVRDTPQDFGKYFEERSGVWLAWSGDEPVGCIAMRPLPDIAGACEVKRLYVKPHCRGRGIAEMLLNALHADAAQCGYFWCYLDSKDELQAAIKFYKRSGYEECERYNDNPDATIFMRYRVPGGMVG